MQSQSQSPYYRAEPGPLAAQPLDMDQPYPAPGPDGFHTVSFYAFFAIPAGELPALRDAIQAEWSRDLGVVGRIYIGEQGINAQLSIPAERTRGLRAWLEQHAAFSGRISRFNWAIEHRRAFKALHVRVRPMVALDAPVALETLAREPEYLSPAEWEQALRQEGPGALLIDMRNTYEYRIGRFQNAVCPDADTFRDEMELVRGMCRGRPPDAPIYMYCTGGIRCSVAGAILKAEGHANVKTLQGGVIAYGRHVRSSPGSQSIYRGKNFTFDKRLGEEVTDDVLAQCDQCGAACDTFTNCANTSCNLLFIQCPACAARHRRTCGNALCLERARMSHDELVRNRMGPIWNYHMRIHPEKVFGRDGVARHPQSHHHHHRSPLPAGGAEAREDERKCTAGVVE
ncbi:hypothetical protein H4R18_005624 [Coemansia javaensis]|uniref:Rhodanese domain-containing protein n=1 Tax=Coemansia javaensis TaxID=2761396 RepID=A0A9W8H1A7_9FUNG|nr:hypothetical protein H4R18_005624 [Coemansia javaensis]